MPRGGGWGIRLTERAKALYGKEMGEADALAWAGEFEWSAEQKSRDSNGVLAAGGLEAYIEQVQRAGADARLSEARVDRVVRMVPGLRGDRDFVEATRRVKVAARGMGVRMHDSFVPNTAPPELRQAERRLARPINKLIGKCWDKGFCLLVNTELLTKEQWAAAVRYHWSHSGWARKREKPQGRNTHDASFAKGGAPCLNLPRKEVKAIGVAQYGEISLPQLRGDILPRIVAAIGRGGNRRRVLIKMDLAGAFHLLFFNPRSALWMLSALTGDLSVVWHTGNFGHSHTPNAFQAVSKFLQLVVNERGRSRGRDYGFDVYVDDLCGVCYEGEEEAVRDEVYEVIRELLGPDAVAEDKTAWSRRLVLVGWDIDLETETIRMAEHISLKFIFHADQVSGGKVSGRSLEVLAALVERLSALCPILNVFKGHLYSNYCRLRDMDALVSLLPLSALALALASRVVGQHMETDHGYPFSHFAPRARTYTVEFDGSIYGAGCRVFNWRGEADEELVVEVSLDLPEDVAQSEELKRKCQNGNELLAVVLGLHVVHHLSGGAVGVGVRGDSQVALSWILTDHFSSPFAHRPALAWVLLETEASMQVVHQKWIPEAENTECDRASRRLRPSPKVGVELVTPESDSPLSARLRRVVELCNPLLADSPLVSSPDLEAFFHALRPGP